MTKRYHGSEVRTYEQGGRYGVEIRTVGKPDYVVPPTFSSEQAAYRYAQKHVQKQAR
jgi:hypothetical protein